MNSSTKRYFLGSRSPRRKELLAYLVPENEITILPPSSVEEKSFEDVSTWDEIIDRVSEISKDKMDDVFQQIVSKKEQTQYIVLTADTVVVVQEKQTDQYTVLGQPPESSDWQQIVRQWFEKYYVGQDHFVVSAFSLKNSDGKEISQTVTTQVRFRSDSLQYLDWYLSTGESQGKAGGYGIQGKGSLFLDRLEGSLTNVIGLPLNALSQALRKL